MPLYCSLTIKMNDGLNTVGKLYTIDQAAKFLAVSKITMYRLVETRKIPFYKIKSCIRFAENDLLDYLDRNRIDPVN